MKKITAIQIGICLSLITSAAQGQRSLDESARALGFQSFQHYQASRTICLELLNKTPLTTRNCGTDIQCLQQEGAAMQQRYTALTQSSPWKYNNCDEVIKVESSANNTQNSNDEVYTIETSHNDELFIINGEKFEAQTYCMDLFEGDQVIFIEGSPLGACSSAKVVNLRTRNECNLWCE
ncbi:MAG: hypothetical protein LPK18_05630 [Pseudomonadaceae bacterium]|nr:hypothetical protein [Pseudomonadaceae bacterium]